MTDRQGLAALLSIVMLVSGGAVGGIVLWSCKDASRVEVKTVKADTRPIKARSEPSGVQPPRLVPTTTIELYDPCGEVVKSTNELVHCAFAKVDGLPEIKLLKKKEPIE